MLFHNSRLVLLFGCVCLLFAFLGAAQNVPLEQKLDAYLTAYHDTNKFNGAALVARDGEVILEKGYGMANFEWQIANDPDTRFRLGSVTKQFTAMLVLQLVQEGKLSLDTPVSDVLPAYRRDSGAVITVHHLLRHTSGLPNYTSEPGMMFVSLNRESVAEFVANHCSRDLEFAPGSRMAYSNSGYYLLGAMIEALAGKPYAQVLRERILTPLGMADTCMESAGSVVPRRAYGYAYGLDGLRRAPALDVSMAYAAGGMVSTVKDLLLWDRALYQDTLLADSLKEKMFTPGLNDYGYGWTIAQIAKPGGRETRKVVMHGGGINGFTSLIARQLQDRCLVVLLNNTGGAPLRDIAQGIQAILDGQEAQMPKLSMAHVLLEKIQQAGVAKALEQFPVLRDSGSYSFSEQEFNDLGYNLLRQGNTEEARAVFALNCELYPLSANTYDSLAEAYMAMGNRKQAIVHYAKSLQLDAGNRNALEKLNRLMQPEAVE